MLCYTFHSKPQCHLLQLQQCVTTLTGSNNGVIIGFRNRENKLCKYERIVIIQKGGISIYEMGKRDPIATTKGEIVSPTSLYLPESNCESCMYYNLQARMYRGMIL